MEAAQDADTNCPGVLYDALGGCPVVSDALSECWERLYSVVLRCVDVEQVGIGAGVKAIRQIEWDPL